MLPQATGGIFKNMAYFYGYRPYKKGDWKYYVLVYLVYVPIMVVVTIWLQKWLGY